MGNNTSKLPLGIYIHIPFCIKKCSYCDFLSMQADDLLARDYISAVIKEIELIKDLYKDYFVKTIFIGGGTPSSIKESFITKILDTIYKNFNMDLLEVSIEVNPGTVNKEKLTEYKKSGINRLSIGLQTANNDELKLLSRIHTFEDFLQTYSLAIDVGFSNINVDLMSALPNQTINSWIDTLNKIVNLKPQHISAYSLIIEENTPFHNQFLNNQLNLPNEDMEREIYYKTNEILSQHGYFRYEISNYSKPDYKCIHNLSYWERANYLGIGLNSSSLIDNYRFKNIDNISKYIEKASKMESVITDKNKLTIKEQMEEFVFLGLRITEGISKLNFKKIFNKDIVDVYEKPITNLIKNNLLIDSGDKLKLTHRGIDISNYCLSEFLI